MRGLRAGAMVAVAVLSAVVFGVSSAAAAAPPDPYSLAISPGAVASGSSTNFTFSLAVGLTSDSPIGSATFTAPAGFTITAASLPAGAGNASFTASTITLKNMNVQSGASVNVSVTATVPAGSCSPTTYTWESSVWQASNPGNGEALVLSNPGAGQQTTVGPPAGTHLAFVAQPADALVNSPITSQAYNPSGPPVEVDVLNSCNQPVTSTDTVSLNLNAPDPGAGATLSGGTAQTSGGKATFPSLKVNAPDNGYTLTATDSGGSQSTTSSSFNVTNQGTACPQNTSCTDNTTSSNGNDATVTASPQTGPNSGVLEQSVAIGTTHPLDCSSAANGGYTSVSPDTFAFKMIPSTNRTEVWTVTLKHPLLLPAIQTILAGPAQVCYGSQTEFTMANGLPAPPGILPDGSAGFIGTLPNCVASGGFGPTGGPCIDQNNVQKPVDLTNGAGVDQIVPIDVPQGQGDPMRH